MERLDAVLLCGAIGVGKSTVLFAIGDVLETRDDPYALVDLDWLAWVRPAPDASLDVGQILATNLAAACRTFRQAGVTRLAMARAVETLDDVTRIHTALGAPSRLRVVTLTALPDEVARRLRARDTGDRLADHLSESERFAATIAGTGDPKITIATDDRTPESIAHEVLTRIAWTPAA